jgi:hypothetical protein
MGRRALTVVPTAPVRAAFAPATVAQVGGAAHERDQAGAEPENEAEEVAGAGIGIDTFEGGFLLRGQAIDELVPEPGGVVVGDEFLGGEQVDEAFLLEALEAPVEMDLREGEDGGVDTVVGQGGAQGQLFPEGGGQPGDCQ